MKRQQPILSSDNSTQRILKPKLIQHKKSSIIPSSSITSPNPYTTAGSNNNNKIMLTDLCPQQKAKIGQLIKTLQQRKVENEQLSQHLTTYKVNFIQLQKRNQQLEYQLQQQSNMINKLNEEIEIKEKQLMGKEIELQQLRITNNKYEELAKLKMLTISIGVETEGAGVVSREVQTREKKRRCKDREVQVDNMMDRLRNNIGGEVVGNGNGNKQRRNNLMIMNNNNNNSKSFQKIMRMKNHLQQQQQQSMSQSMSKFKQKNKCKQLQQQQRYYNQENVISEDDDVVVREEEYDDGSEEGEYEEERLESVMRENGGRNMQRGYDDKVNLNNNKNNNNNNSSNWSKYSSSDHNNNHQHRSPSPQIQHLQQKSTSNRLHHRDLIQVEDTQNDDDQFEMLARKWMELKEKNIQQLSQGWVQEESNRNNSNVSNSNSKRQMESGGGSMKRKQKKNIDRNNYNSNNNTSSIRPHITKTFQTSNNNNNNQKQQQLYHQQQQQAIVQQNQLIDELQLNRALKSKDFSASKLLYNNINSMSRSKRRDTDNNNNSDTNSRKWQVDKKLSSNFTNNNNSNHIYKVINSNDSRTAPQPTNYHKQPAVLNPIIINKQQQHNNPSSTSGFYNEQLLDLVEEINK